MASAFLWALDSGDRGMGPLCNALACRQGGGGDAAARGTGTAGGVGFSGVPAPGSGSVGFGGPQTGFSCAGG